MTAVLQCFACKHGSHGMCKGGPRCHCTHRDAESLLDEIPRESAVRAGDPESSRRAAADNEVEKQRQWRLILERLHSGPISADTAGRVIGKHRSIASSRLGVMVKRGLVEKCEGLVVERSEDTGAERPVLRYRLTPAGEAEYQLMFKGAA